MNKILEIYNYSERTVKIRIDNRWVAKSARPGNFVIIRFFDDGARVPFSIVGADRDKGTIDIIIHRASGLEDLLPLLQPGHRIHDLLGPLGKQAELDENATVICCGDGAGFVPMLAIIQGLHSNGCRVISVVSEESAKATCLLHEIEKYSDTTILAAEGSVTETVAKAMEREKADKVYMSGPTTMMMAIRNLTIDKGVDSRCVLNMLMIDGIGLCGICRVRVDNELKLTCIDGPVFDAKKVDFDGMLNRQRHYN